MIQLGERDFLSRSNGGACMLHMPFQYCILSSPANWHSIFAIYFWLYFIGATVPKKSSILSRALRERKELAMGEAWVKNENSRRWTFYHKFFTDCPF